MIYAIDFDDTLNYTSIENKFLPNKNLISFLKDKDFFILTARDETDSNKNYINNFLKEYSLSPIKIMFSNHGPKGPILKQEGANLLIDDNSEQRLSAENNGVRALDPTSIDIIKRMNTIKKKAVKKKRKAEKKNSKPAGGGARKPKRAPTIKKKSEVLKDLVVIANRLDSIGLLSEANYIDSILKIASSDERTYSFIEIISKNNCFDCNAEGVMHRHHVVPSSRGGTRWVPLCEECHAKAHHRDRAMTTSRLTADALSKKRERGEYTGGPIPIGYQVIPGTSDGLKKKYLVYNQKERYIIDRARALRDQGLSFRAISEKLSEEGYNQRNGRPFHPSAVQRMIMKKDYEIERFLPVHNPSYLSEAIYDAQTGEIVDPPTWEMGSEDSEDD